jgi:hypothetical protein
MSMNSIPGFISRPSPHSVPETLQRLAAILKSKGVAIFALVDHSGEAEKAGLKMRPTRTAKCGSATIRPIISSSATVFHPTSKKTLQQSSPFGPRCCLPLHFHFAL